jgi:hypothetical protein
VLPEHKKDERYTATRRTRAVREILAVMPEYTDRVNAIREAYGSGTITKQDYEKLLEEEKLRSRYDEAERKLKEQPARVRAQYIDEVLKGKSLEEQSGIRGRLRRKKIFTPEVRKELGKIRRAERTPNGGT